MSNAEMAKVREEMDALGNGRTNFPVNMTSARIMKAGIPGRRGCDQLARYYGLRPYDGGGRTGGAWSYIRA